MLTKEKGRGEAACDYKENSGLTVGATSKKVKHSVYGSRPIKRIRRTKSAIQSLDDSFFEILERIQPATVRQTFYQAEVLGLVPKEESTGYRVIQRRLMAMRESGRVPYGWITDNLRIVRGYNRYGNAGEFAKEVSSLYRRDYWRESKVRVEIWIEKDGLASTISPVVIDEWGLDLHVTRGFSSASYLHAASENLVQDGRPTFVYVLTDLDPSGVDIARDIGAKLQSMVAARAELHVERLAVEPWQVEQWQLPSRPTKQTDTRAAKFISKFGNASVELDSIDPNTLRQIVGDAIAKHADTFAITRLKLTEQAERQSIAAWQHALKT